MTHLYLMPGMAANPSIFEHISLPKDRFTIHLLEWQLPEKKETISDYAKRMAAFVTHKDSVLLGVSFGGVLVQEMAKHVSLKKLIIVSSVKSKYELPRRMKLSRKLKLYNILPTRLIEDVDKLAKYAFGETVKNRVELYQKYLSMNDRHYMSWAVKEMVCWDQEEPDPNIVHIHGDADRVFPIKYIDNCVTLPGGSHIMVITKYKWFNENLPQLIEND
ncbi:alpha/beta hydrolase [uncultured Dokdonia sp.]|uniref:alpha/beta fold hydrolase n=1 Tax=uncultured Dokdonia sp. TaxID=575653 RepID=UPI00263A1C52|nr:alpha/beta hydrolase [uncultured Dokdonia sp.]